MNIRKMYVHTYLQGKSGIKYLKKTQKKKKLKKVKLNKKKF